MLTGFSMLNARWREIMAGRGQRTALWHHGLELPWTYADLDRRAEELVGSIDDTTEYVIAQADQVDFLPMILAGWKTGTPVLVLETSHCRPRAIRSAIPDGTVFIKQSCGASGVERSLFLDERAVLAEAARNIEGLGLVPERVGLVAISLAHTYGLGCLALPLLLGGIPLDVISAPLPMFLQQAFDRHHACFLPGVPALWKTWMMSDCLDHPSLELAVSAGSPLTLEIEEKIHRATGTKVHNFYGTSETGAVAFDSTDSLRSDEGLLGSLLEGVEVTISQDGRILVKSDAMATGADLLLRDDEFTTGNYRTSDTGRLENGSLFWSAHQGRAINVAGRKVSPDKVIRVCQTTEGVVRVEVKSVQSRDPERFQEVAVFLELAQDAELKTIKSAVYDRLESWEMPRHWKQLD